MFTEIFPPIETALGLQPEELGPFVLKHLKQMGRINRYNYTLGTDPAMVAYAGPRLTDFRKHLMEAFIWLEREMFVAPQPGDTGEDRFITRRGERILQEEDFKTYAKESLLPSETLDPILARAVRPLFLRGDYDTAIFRAFKEVEVRVRKIGRYPNSDYGVSLMRKAFHPDTGALTNTKSEKSEKEAMMHLFSGAIGLFKNPVSHRDIGDVSPEWTADIIRFANCLLKMVDG